MARLYRSTPAALCLARSSKNCLAKSGRKMPNPRTIGRTKPRRRRSERFSAQLRGWPEAPRFGPASPAVEDRAYDLSRAAQLPRQLFLSNPASAEPGDLPERTIAAVKIGRIGNLEKLGF